MPDSSMTVKSRVAGMDERHDRLYRYIEKYNIMLNAVPSMDDMVFEMQDLSRKEVYRVLSELAEAGCLGMEAGGKSFRPKVSPEDALMWCGDDENSRIDQKYLIEKAVYARIGKQNGEIPSFDDFMDDYRGSALYGLIRVRAETVFNGVVSMFGGEETGMNKWDAPRS